MKRLKSCRLSKINIILIVVILLGLFLRLVGIKHGFPFIFHPDEPTIVRSALGVRFYPNPKHFDWPHLYIYLNYFLYMVFARFRSLMVGIGLRDKIGLIFPLIWDEKMVFYYLTRCFSAILGAFTAIPVYLAGKNLFGKKVGFLGALAITIMPYHVWHSHYSLGDVPMVFFLSWGMYFSTLIIKYEDFKNYIFAGLFIGLAASTKYNGGLSALMVPLAHFLRIFWRKYEEKRNIVDKIKVIDLKGILSLFISGVFAFLGFLVGTPYALLDYKTFSRTDGPAGAFWQFTNVGSVGFLDHLKSFFGDIFGKLAGDTGYITMYVFALGFFLLIYKFLKRKIEQGDVFLTFLYSISLFLIWYISGFNKSRSHYYFIFYPFVAIIFGYYGNLFQQKIRECVVNLNRISSSKTLSYIFIFIFYSPLFVFSGISSYRYYKGDTRNDFYQWMIKNYHPTETVVYNDNKVEDIFGAIGIRAVKGTDNFNKIENPLLVILEKDNEDEEFLEDHSGLEEVAFFDEKYRLGPKINVYRYSQDIN